MKLLRVSAKSNPNSVAGALAGAIRERGKTEMQAIGVGQLTGDKAVAIPGLWRFSGIDLVCVPAFVDVQIDSERTAIKFIVT